MAKSTDNPISRYVQGGVTDVLEKSLGWWERIDIPKRDDDITYIVPVEYVIRPDLIAYDVYGSPDLLWLVLQFNNILDPTTELYAGKELRLPTPSRVRLSVLTRSV